jgi:hypothetical protein
VQVLCAVVAVGIDVAAPFSDAEAVADYIREHDLERAVIVGQPDIAASTVAGYLDHEIIYPEGDRTGRFIIWDDARVDDQQRLTDVVDEIQRGARPVLLLVNEPVADPASLDATLLAIFDDGIVADEHFWLYRIAPA